MTRENTFSALVNIKDELDAFLTRAEPDLSALDADKEWVREELVEILRKLFSEDLEFVSDEEDPFGKSRAYGRAA